MDIAAMGGGAGLDFQNMKEMMRGKKGIEGAEETLAQSVVEQVASATSVEQTGGVMSRNFASAPQGETESYAQKTLAGKQAASIQASRQNAVLNSAMAQVATADSYAARNLAGKRAARSMMQEMQRTVQEESARNLKEAQNATETAADEAVAQGSASAFTAETVASAAAAPAAPAPPAPDTSASGSAVAAPSTPSVDVTV